MLKGLADAVKQHYAHGLSVFPDHKGSQGRQAHKEVFIHDVAGLHVFKGGKKHVLPQDQVSDHKAENGDAGHGAGEKRTGDEKSGSGQDLWKIAGMLLIMNVFLALSLLPDRDPGTRLDLIGDLLHFGKEGRTGRGIDPELPGGKGEDGVVHLRKLLYFRLDLGGAVGAVDIFQVVDHIRGLGISGSDLDHCAGLDLIGDVLQVRKEGCTGRGIDPELPGGKGEDGIVHLRKLLYFRFDLGRAVGAVNVFHHIDRTGGAWGIVVSMAVGVLVGMAVLVAVLMSAAAGALSVVGVLVRMFVGMSVFVVVFMSAGALPVMGVLVRMFMGMAMFLAVLVAAAAPLMAAAVFCRIFRSVQMFVLFHNYALRMSFFRLVRINI